MFLRVLVWLVLLIAGWWFVRKSLRGAPPPPPRPAAAPAAPAIAQPEPMVDCVHCGLHLPASEALRDDAARAFCCAEHRVAGPRAP
jgi:uncharacterized protein